MNNSNIQYESIVRAKLIEHAFPSSQIDAITQKLIAICDEQGINILQFMDEYVLEHADALKRSVSRELAGTSRGTSFTTTRYEQPKTGKFIRRQIIYR